MTTKGRRGFKFTTQDWTRTLPPQRNKIDCRFRQVEIWIANDPRRGTATRDWPISSSSCASVSAILIGRRDAARVRPAPPMQRQPDDATTRWCLPQTHQTMGRCSVMTSLNGTVGCFWKISGDMFVMGSYWKKMDGQGRRRNRLWDARTSETALCLILP